MKIRLKTGKRAGEVVEIDDAIIQNYMTKYECTQSEAIQEYLDNMDIEPNQEEIKKQKEIDENSDYKIDRGPIEEKKERKTRVAKISNEKQKLFECLKENLENLKTSAAIDDYNVEINNKLFIVSIGDKKIKVDIIEQRPNKE